MTAEMAATEMPALPLPQLTAAPMNTPRTMARYAICRSVATTTPYQTAPPDRAAASPHKMPRDSDGPSAPCWATGVSVTGVRTVNPVGGGGGGCGSENWSAGW